MATDSREPTETGAPMVEYVYVLMPREHVRLRESVLKVGRTGRAPGRRLVEYPADSVVYRIKATDNSIAVERRLLAEFGARFERTPYGSEYFRGHIPDMLACFDDFSNTPTPLPTCESCGLTVLSATVGDFFCCGVMHFVCIDRHGACPTCKLSFVPGRLRVYHYGQPRVVYTGSHLATRTSLPEEATVLVLNLYPDNVEDGVRLAYQALYEEKICYIFYGDGNWSREDMLRLTKLSSLIHGHSMLPAILFRPYTGRRPTDSLHVATNRQQVDFVN